jgi:hypothetical protein
MQSSTSFFRFVLEHLVRHAETCRENFPIETGLLMKYRTTKFRGRPVLLPRYQQAHPKSRYMATPNHTKYL